MPINDPERFLCNHTNFLLFNYDEGCDTLVKSSTQSEKRDCKYTLQYHNMKTSAVIVLCPLYSQAVPLPKCAYRTQCDFLKTNHCAEHEFFMYFYISKNRYERITCK